MRSIRVAAKAIIIRDGKLLLVRNRDERGDWYLLPGGGQRHGERLTEALQRECLEEVGARVIVGRLRLVRDYIGRHHEFADEDDHVHQVELMFECELADGEEPCVGDHPDDRQTGVVWLDLDALATQRVYPRALAEACRDRETTPLPIYLGDVN